MRIITWNINGLKSATEKGDFKLLVNDNADIICLQEVKISDQNYIRENIPNDYNIYINMAEKNGYSGVAIITKYKPKTEKYSINIERFDKEGRCIVLEFDNFCIYNLYIPHGGRDKKNLDYKLNVCNKIIKILEDNIKENKKIIICTDFNIAHTDIDLARPKQNKNNIMFTNEERNIVDKVLQIGMIDSFRLITNLSNNYTWWPYAFNARERNLGWRIDYIFVSKNLKEKIEDVRILKEITGSDHCPSEIVLNID